MNGHVLVQRDITKCKNVVRSLKIFLLENHRAKIAQIYKKTSWRSADSSLYKLWSSGVEMGHNRGNNFTWVYWKESFKMKHLTNFNQTWYKPFLHERNSSIFKSRAKSSSKGDNHKSAKIGWVMYRTKVP
jgi:hypothetical protein